MNLKRVKLRRRTYAIEVNDESYLFLKKLFDNFSITLKKEDDEIIIDYGDKEAKIKHKMVLLAIDENGVFAPHFMDEHLYSFMYEGNGFRMTTDELLEMLT